MTSKSVNHDAIWELIPWYINASLPRSEAEAVERHRMACPACAEEIERQLTVASGVCMDDPCESPQARSWNILRARIEAEGHAPGDALSPEARHWEGLRQRVEAEQSSRRSPVARWTGWLPDLRGGLALGGTLCAALAIAIVIAEPDKAPGQFRTQADAPQPPSQSRSMLAPSRQSRQVITFEATLGSDREAIERVLADNGLTLIEGPSDGGVYRASAPPDVKLDDALETLIERPEILVAAPE